jgi:hypothetical protein
MASFHELNRTERAERSYPMYVRNNTPAWIAGIVIVLAAVAGPLRVLGRTPQSDDYADPRNDGSAAGQSSAAT